MPACSSRSLRRAPGPVRARVIGDPRDDELSGGVDQGQQRLLPRHGLLREPSALVLALLGCVAGRGRSVRQSGVGGGGGSSDGSTTTYLLGGGRRGGATKSPRRRSWRSRVFFPFRFID